MSFRTNYPFDFCLLNSKEEDVFYLEDKVEGVTLKVTNQLKASMQFSASGEKADANNYHFALKFRPDVLSDRKKGEQAVGEWKISDAVPDAQGCSVLYMLFAGAAPLICESKSSIEIKFLVDINGSKGSRTTNVELLGKNISAGDIQLEDSNRQINWTLINHRGKSGLPLQLSFKDADTILNDGVTRNSLSLRISNTNKSDADGDKAIEFNENSRILFFFDPNQNSTASALANADAVQRIGIEEKSPSGSVHFNVVPPSGQEALPVWRFMVADSAGLRLLPMISGGSGTGVLTRPIPAQIKVTNARAGKLTSKADNCVNGRLVTEGDLLFTVDNQKIFVPITGKFIQTIDKDKFAVDKLLDGYCQVGYIKSFLGVQNDRAADMPDNITYVDFLFTNIITNYITGKTRLSVRLENIPGYWDETFVLHIDKQPMIFQDQNVGIGTNTPAQKLQITVNKSGLNFPLLLSNLNGTEGNGNAVGLGFINEANGNWVKSAIVHERVAGYGVGSLKFLVNNDVNSNSVTLADARMTIASNGNVGVNTTSPQINLDVKGTLGVKNDAAWDHMMIHHDGATGYVDAGGAENGLALRVGNTNSGIYGQQPYPEIMRLLPSGNVGIGTANPSRKLQVEGDLQASNFFIKGTHLAYDSQHAVINWGSQSTGNLYFRTLRSQGNINDYRDLAVITSDGRMGVNTNSPQQTLDVIGGIGIRNDAAWDHMMMHHDGATGYIDAGGAENGLAFRVGDTNSGSYWQQGYNEAMRLKANGHVIINGRLGIGNPNPEFPIDVNSWNNVTMQKGFWFLMDGACRDSHNTYSNSVSIRASQGMYCNAYYCFSDERIKEEIVTVDSQAALELLNKLVVKNYYYKDYVAQGSGLKRGFVAQEVEKNIPEAVSITKDFTPNIYSLPEKVVRVNGLLTISLKKAHELSTGDRVRIITEGNGVQDVHVNVADELNFTVNDWTFSEERLFIYGKEVDDFRTLDYDYIFCTGISAIQALSKQVDTLTQQLRQQENRLERLEALVARPD
ncbi:hypothetical protein ACVWYF_003591 [Hymenobacter sp. UYAg731]